MLIERTNKNQITITVSSSVDSFGLQRVIDYVKSFEATIQISGASSPLKSEQTIPQNQNVFNATNIKLGN